MYAALCEPLLRRPGAAAAGAAAAASLRYHCAAQCCAVACRTSGRFRAARSSGVQAASPSVLVRCCCRAPIRNRRHQLPLCRQQLDRYEGVMRWVAAIICNIVVVGATHESKLHGRHALALTLCVLARTLLLAASLCSCRPPATLYKLHNPKNLLQHKMSSRRT